MKARSDDSFPWRPNYHDEPGALPEGVIITGTMNTEPEPQMDDEESA